MGILDELGDFETVKNPDNEAFARLLDYAGRLVKALKWQRKFSSQLNKKRMRVKYKLAIYEQELIESGADMKRIQKRVEA